MASTVLGLVLDSCVLIAAERRKLTASQVIADVVKRVGDVPVILSPMTIAEVAEFIAPIRKRSVKVGVRFSMN
jgi:hypothetical protein